MTCGFTKIDLANIINIIDVCTKRGAFQAAEMSGVGTLYDRLKKAHDAHNECEKNGVDKLCEKGGMCDLNCDEGECKREEVLEPPKTCCLEGVCPVDEDCERMEDMGDVGKVGT